MLIQFSVANFRSFNQEQTLDLTASNYFSELQENTFRPIKRKKLSLLKAIGIYGANASGKSSLVYALRFMKRQVSTLNREPHEKIDTKPFKLSKTMLSRPSQFEVIFVADNQQYQYGFSCTDKAFTQEWLFINGKPVGENDIALNMIKSIPASNIAENAKYGLAVESGKRTSIRRPLGLETKGIRIEAERLRAE